MDGTPIKREKPIKIDDIQLTKSRVDIGGRHNPFVFHIEMGGVKFTGYFETWPDFLLMVTECAKFFAFKWGKLSKAQANKELTRELQ